MSENRGLEGSCTPVLMSRIFRMLLASLLGRFPLMARMAFRWPLLARRAPCQSHCPQTPGSQARAGFSDSRSRHRTCSRLLSPVGSLVLPVSSPLQPVRPPTGCSPRTSLLTLLRWLTPSHLKFQLNVTSPDGFAVSGQQSL